jgi:GNAT superfamily N-acetyltransferase
MFPDASPSATLRKKREATFRTLWRRILRRCAKSAKLFPNLSLQSTTWKSPHNRSHKRYGSPIRFREFQPGDAAAFRALNEEWITRYFAKEPRDEAFLADPRGTILDRGGRIFFAVRDGQPIGCCALLAIAPGEFEVAKTAVTESSRRAGVGRRLLEKAIAEAHVSGANRLYLENRKLAPYARTNVYMELYLDRRAGAALHSLDQSYDG